MWLLHKLRANESDILMEENGNMYMHARLQQRCEMTDDGPANQYQSKNSVSVRTFS